MRISGLLCAPALLLAAALPAFSNTILYPSVGGYVGSGNYMVVVKVTFHVGSSSCDGPAPGHCLEATSGWQVTFQTPSGSSTIALGSSFLDPDFGPRTVGMTNLYLDMGVLGRAAPGDSGGLLSAADGRKS